MSGSGGPAPGLTDYFRSRGIAQLSFGAAAHVPARFGDVLEEHDAVRNRVGLFDFSFMAHFEVSGPQAVAYLERLQVRSVAGVAPGRILYTLLCRDDGTVFNDATIWTLGDGRFWLFTGRRADVGHIRDVAGDFDVTVADISGAYAIIAVQGPSSVALLQRASLSDVAALRYFRFLRGALGERPAWLGRIGYSGERGYELLVDARAGAAVWEALRDAGRPLGVVECGFEAADRLRIEAGYILFERELRYRISPRGIGYQRLAAERGDGGYIGAAALHDARRRIEPAVLMGLVPVREPRAEQWLADTESPSASTAPPVAAGRACLTSACWSPSLARCLGMGYVAAQDRHPGSTVRLAGGRLARVARLPYYDPPRLRPRGR